MQWSDIPLDPPRQTLRQFAGLWLLFFTGLASWQAIVRENTNAACLYGGLAAVIGLVGLAHPRFIRPVFVGCMIATFPIGWVVSHVLLAVVFYGLLTPLAVIFRLAGRDPLQLRCPQEKETCWKPKPQAESVQSYFRQF
jgi:hypothetical protein